MYGPAPQQDIRVVGDDLHGKLLSWETAPRPRSDEDMPVNFEGALQLPSICAPYNSGSA
jgi:hypothetical protein